MFDPLEHQGLPLDRHGQHWHELDSEPGSGGAADPDTVHRIATMQALQRATVTFDRQLSQRCPDIDAHRSVARLGAWASQRRHDLAARRPSSSGALDRAVDSAQVAFDLVSWVARNEPDTDLSMAYQQLAREDLERLRSYAELTARAGLGWAASFAQEVEDMRPGVASGPTQTPTAHPVSVLHDWAVHAAHRQAATYAADVEPIRGEQPHLVANGASDWEQLVVHESAICYLYYCFLQQETDPKVRPLWELHLQMELAHLQDAADLLRRIEDRDPHEVTGSGLPEPVAFADRQHGVAMQGTPAIAGNGRHGLVDLLTQQHIRIESLFKRVQEGTGEGRHAAFGDLARLMAVHEVVEEEVVHPLVRRLDPNDPLADRLLDEERQISDALADAVRADAANGRAEVSAALREMVRSHARHEEQEEFPRVLRAVPPEESRQMTRAVYTAQEAAPAGEQTLPQTADRVRDALRELSREVSV